MLQHPATLRNTLQHPATHRNTLQHTATHCNRELNSVYVGRDGMQRALFMAPQVCAMSVGSVLQRVAACCSVL